MRYLAVEDIIRINESVLKSRSLVRDRNMLEAAVERPRQSVFGKDAYPTLTEKAAALLHSLILNHPFVDGNKRTATVALIIFLQINGRAPGWNPAEALEYIIEIAQGLHSPAQIAGWLDSNTTSQG